MDSQQFNRPIFNQLHRRKRAGYEKEKTNFVPLTLPLSPKERELAETPPQVDGVLKIIKTHDFSAILKFFSVRRGQAPLIPGTGQRFSCNMISAITNKGLPNFLVFKRRFSSEVLIGFLKRLVKHSDQKVFIIVDGHPAYRAIKFKN